MNFSSRGSSLVFTVRFLVCLRLRGLRLRLGQSEAQFLHERHFLRPLPQFRLPVLAGPCVLGGQRRSVAGKARGLAAVGESR